MPFVFHRDAIQDSAAAANDPRIRNVLMLFITLVQICARHLFFTGMQFKTLPLLPMAHKELLASLLLRSTKRGERSSRCVQARAAVTFGVLFNGVSLPLRSTKRGERSSRCVQARAAVTLGVLFNGVSLPLRSTKRGERSSRCVQARAAVKFGVLFNGVSLPLRSTKRGERSLRFSFVPDLFYAKSPVSVCTQLCAGNVMQTVYC